VPSSYGSAREAQLNRQMASRVTIRPVLMCVIATLCVACSRPADTSSYPTLVIDDKHWDRPQATWEAYEFSPSSGIRINTGQFDFKYGAASETPDMIHLLLNNSQMFKLSTPAESDVYLLDRNTLKPMQQSGAFSGFHSGDRWIVAIGTVDPQSPETDELYISWLGHFEVQ
jgi:hypothetical protein